MPMSTASLRIALDPYVSCQIITYCNSQLSGKDSWQWKSVKEGVQKVMLYQLFAAVATAGLVVSQAYPEEPWAVGLLALSGLTFSCTLYHLHAQSEKIAGIIAPHLKITSCGVKPIRLVTPLREAAVGTGHGASYGAVSATGSTSHTAVKISPSQE